jgi:hypothetical protein
MQLTADGSGTDLRGENSMIPVLPSVLNADGLSVTK